MDVPYGPPWPRSRPAAFHLWIWAWSVRRSDKRKGSGRGPWMQASGSRSISIACREHEMTPGHQAKRRANEERGVRIVLASTAKVRPGGKPNPWRSWDAMSLGIYSVGFMHGRECSGSASACIVSRRWRPCNVRIECMRFLAYAKIFHSREKSNNGFAS